MSDNDKRKRLQELNRMGRNLVSVHPDEIYEQLENITDEVIQLCGHNVGEVIEWVSTSLAYDQLKVRNLVIEHGDPAQVIQFAITGAGIDVNTLLMDYIDVNYQEKQSFVKGIIANYVRIVPHVSPQHILNSILDGFEENSEILEHDKVLLDFYCDLLLSIALNYSLISNDNVGMITDILVFLFKHGNWQHCAHVCVTFPTIAKYLSESDIYQVDMVGLLSSTDEEHVPFIIEFAEFIFKVYAGDVEMHTGVMGVCQNPILEQRFTELAKEEFDSIFGTTEEDPESDIKVNVESDIPTNTCNDEEPESPVQTSVLISVH